MLRESGRRNHRVQWHPEAHGRTSPKCNRKEFLAKWPFGFERRCLAQLLRKAELDFCR